MLKCIWYTIFVYGEVGYLVYGMINIKRKTLELYQVFYFACYSTSSCCSGYHAGVQGMPSRILPSQ